MTVAVAVSAVDSIVLASDSATTQQIRTQAGQIETINIWNSANKIFNLRKTWPVGAVTWGRASLGGRSIATLAKELRCRLSGERPSHQDWALDPANYTIQAVAERVKTFFYDEHYQTDPNAKEVLGLMVAGYSAGSDTAELYVIEMDQSACRGPDKTGQSDQPVLTWRGVPEAISRLANGISGKLPEALLQLGVPQGNVQAYVQRIKEKTGIPLVDAGMPVGEVIDLAEFLVEATIKFVRFAPGHQVVGGPVEIAAMTRHEGFKWIKRKHHFPHDLNPVESLP